MLLGAKIQPLIILGVALMGLLLGETTALGNVSSWCVELFLMALLYVLFLTVDLGRLRESFKNTRYALVSLSINFVVTPIIAFLLGVIFFPDSVEVRLGLIMLLVTPCTDWYLVFTALSKGNVELNLSILPMNLILQIVLMPVYLFIFLGNQIQIDAEASFQSVVWVLGVPVFMALLTRKAIESKDRVKERIANQSDNLQLLFLCLAVVAMFASQGSVLFDNIDLLFKLFVPLLMFFAMLFVIAQGAGRACKFERRDVVSLTFTTLARNSPLALALAVAAFPDLPLVSLTLVIGPLIELPILFAISHLLLRRSRIAN